ncbi:MAG TPA: DUF58 domain-containing protein [Planctomycetota bacterium]|nr:DUF58 domain-containing protein [Planctomycetota bacterium]
MAEDIRRLLPAETLNQVSGLEIKARRIVEGFVSGLHESPYKGASVEFAEHREYVPGDDLRRLDWKVLAKTDRFYVKEYEEETNLKAYVVVDVSRSMTYAGTSGLSKLEYARQAAAALAYLVAHQRDAVALVLFDAKLRKFLPPASSPAHLRNIFTALIETEPEEKTDVGAIFHEIAERLRQRSLVLILSDLFDDVERVVSGLNHMSHRGHDVAVFHVLHQDEIEFPFEAMTRFEGLEVDQKLLADPKALREAYLAEVDAFRRRVKGACLAGRIDYVPVDTSRSPAVPLATYLGMRARSR